MQVLVHKLLGLAEDADEIEVAYGLTPQNSREVAILSRSMLEIMMQLGYGTELPPGHLAEGRASSGRLQEGRITTPLVRIHSGTQPPAYAYTSVQYKNHWYWIDDTDLASKRTFTFLLILFARAETGQSSLTPVVTVPSP